MQISSAQLKLECIKLCNITTYKKGPLVREEAPQYTDCLTSISYLLDRIAEFNRTKGITFGWLERIGNMPFKIAERWNWDILKRTPEDFQPGDLLFLKKRDSTRELTHVAMVISPEEAFHCTREHQYHEIIDGSVMLREKVLVKNGGYIEKVADLFKRYIPFTEMKKVLNSTDPRPDFLEVTMIEAPKFDVSKTKISPTHSSSSSTNNSLHSSPSLSPASSDLEDSDFQIESPASSALEIVSRIRNGKSRLLAKLQRASLNMNSSDSDSDTHSSTGIKHTRTFLSNPDFNSAQQSVQS